MIRLIIGRLDIKGLTSGLTFKEYDGIPELGGIPNVELTPTASLIIMRVSMVINEREPAQVSSGIRLSEVPEYCHALTCQLLSYVKYTSEEVPRDALVHVPIPTIEPLSTTLGLVLAASGFSVEFYSDLWPQLMDVLAQLKPLNINVAIHTNIFDPNRVFVFDEITRRLIIAPRIDLVRKEGSNNVEFMGNEYRQANIPVNKYAIAMPAEPMVDNELASLIDELVDVYGGVTTLKTLMDLRGPDLTSKALNMGLLVYNPGDLTVRVSMKGLAMRRRRNKHGMPP